MHQQLNVSSPMVLPRRAQVNVCLRRDARVEDDGAVFLLVRHNLLHRLLNSKSETVKRKKITSSF